MLKILEKISNEEAISTKKTQEIASLIVDKNYDYSIEKNYYIPDTPSHTMGIPEQISGVLLNKNINFDINLELFPTPHLKNFFND